MVLWLLSGFFFVSGLSLAIIGIARNKGDITPRQRERDKRLKVHFEDMKKISSNIIPTLTEDYGRIVLFISSSRTSTVTQSIKEDTLCKIPDDFVAHFPKEATTWDTCYLDINAHNEKYAKFALRIREFFGLSGLKVMLVNQTNESPCIYEAVFRPFFVWWRDRLSHTEHPQIDFTKIDVDSPNYGPSNLRVAGWAETIAYAESETDKEKCKSTIRSLANNAKFEQEAINLLESATKLVESIHALKTQLTDTIQNVDKYWPGTTDYKFRRLKQCQTCKKII